MKRLLCKLAACATAAMLLVCCVVPGFAAGKQYDVVFRAGSHGALNGSHKSVVETVAYKAAFPDVPDVTPEQGYVFAGWNEALPAYGSAVTQRQTYVAQYRRLLAGVQYRVRYVDSLGAPLRSPKFAVAEKGSTVTERAKAVAGYTVDAGEKRLTAQQDGLEIVFTYTAVAAASSAAPQQPGGTASPAVPVPPAQPANPAGTQPQPAQPGTTQIPETQTPLAQPESAAPGAASGTASGTGSAASGAASGTASIADQQVPLAKPQDQQPSAVLGTVLCAAAALAAVAIVIVLLLRRRQHRKE